MDGRRSRVSVRLARIPAVLGLLSPVAAILCLVLFLRSRHEPAQAFLWLSYWVIAGLVFGLWVVLQ